MKNTMKNKILIAAVCLLALLGLVATFTGPVQAQTLNGSASILGLTASQIGGGIITNNQTGVTLYGTFVPYGNTNGLVASAVTNVVNAAITNFNTGSQTYTGTHNGTVNGTPATTFTNGFTGTVTNWAVGGTSNRLYYSFGIVTNVTLP